MRKSSVTSRSSFPLGASSCHFTSLGLTAPVSPRSLPCTPWAVPSRCLRKYSWPLPDEPSRFDRHTNMLRGQLAGSSGRSEEHTSELQSLMRISYAVFCLKKKKITRHTKSQNSNNTTIEEYIY